MSIFVQPGLDQKPPAFSAVCMSFDQRGLVGIKIYGTNILLTDTAVILKKTKHVHNDVDDSCMTRQNPSPFYLALSGFTY